MDDAKTSVIGRKTVNIQTKKVILGHEQGDAPDLAPIFVNNVEIIHVGSDFYLDLGIIRPDDIIAAGTPTESGGAPGTAEFFVLQRVAMSRFTFDALMARGNQLLSRIPPAGVTNE